jgi:hypothetical protein
VVLTRDEIVELSSELLVSKAPPTCPTPFSGWLNANADSVGRRYTSELRRNYRSAPGVATAFAGDSIHPSGQPRS